MQSLAATAHNVLVNVDARISTADLRRLLDRIIPAGVQLPYFTEHHMTSPRRERWSWFVYDELPQQDQWQSVRVWYNLRLLDNVALPFLNARSSLGTSLLKQAEDRNSHTYRLHEPTC